MKNNGYSELLLESLAPDSDEGSTKLASEAAAGEVFGRMTKEAQHEIVATSGWAGAELGLQVATALDPSINKIAKVVGLLIPLIERFEKAAADITNNQVPLDSHDMPKVTPGEGIGHSVQESANQDTATGVVEITDDTPGFPGKPQISNMIDQFLKADILTNTQAMGSGNNPPGERPEDFDPGKVRTAAFEGARNFMGKVEKGVNAVRGAASSAGSYIKNNPGKAALGAAGAVGAGVLAKKMMGGKKEEPKTASVTAQRGAGIRRAIQEALSEGE